MLINPYIIICVDLLGVPEMHVQCNPVFKDHPGNKTIPKLKPLIERLEIHTSAILFQD